MKTIRTGIDVQNTVHEQSCPASDPIEALLNRLEQSHGKAEIDKLLRHQAALRVHGQRLEVRARTGFVAEAIRTKLGAALTAEARHCIGPSIEVVIGLDPSAMHPASGAKRTIQHAGARPAPSPKATAARFRLETFIVGDSNKLAFSAATTTSDPAAPRNYSPLVIHGPCGVGKTHLLQAIAHRYRELKPDAVVKTITAEAFTNDFIAAIRSNKVDVFRRAYRGLDLLCVDDIQFLANKEATQQELLHTFDSIDLCGARVVMVSDEHPRDVRQLSAALVSRFMSGMVVRVESPELSLRERLTRVLGERRGLLLEPSAASLIAARAGAAGQAPSVRDIEGALMRVDAVRALMPELSTGAAIGLNIVRTALGIRDDQRSRRPVKVQSICAHVCQELGVPLEEVYGRTRHPRVVLARSLCACLSRELTTMSYPEIARAMGRPGHSSVVTACQRLGKQIKLDQAPERGAECPGQYAGLTVKGLFERLREDIRSAAV